MTIAAALEAAAIRAAATSEDATIILQAVPFGVSVWGMAGGKPVARNVEWAAIDAGHNLAREVDEVRRELRMAAARAQ